MPIGELPEEPASILEEKRDSPRHGFQGDRAVMPATKKVPASLTIAVSREAGSRGNTIGNRAGVKLGWPVYNHELLDYIAQEGAFRQNLAETMTGPTGAWVEERLQKLLREQDLSQLPAMIDIARIILALGAEGGVVLIGRGAGSILPPESTLHVRIVAPLTDRIAYMSQWLRLTREEAAAQVRLRDSHRSEFLAMHYHAEASNIYLYDLILNSSLLGEDACAALIVQAAKAKLAAWEQSGPTPAPWRPESVQ